MSILLASLKTFPHQSKKQTLKGVGRERMRVSIIVIKFKSLVNPQTYKEIVFCAAAKKGGS